MITEFPAHHCVAVSCTSTEFESWEGRNSVVEGHGGTRKIVDGMDIWTYGDPPRRFQVRGIIQDNRPGGIIPMAQMKHDIVTKARQSGGDAIILASSQSQLTGSTLKQRTHMVTEILPQHTVTPQLSRLLVTPRHSSSSNICELPRKYGLTQLLRWFWRYSVRLTTNNNERKQHNEKIITSRRVARECEHSAGRRDC
jgi:hypothetical protein